jgi:hypothetical protein
MSGRVMSLRTICMVCAAMLCLVGAEWWWLGTDAPLAPVSPMRTRTLTPHQSSAARQPADLDKVVATILGRPLLSPSRRPAAAAQDASAVQRTASLPRLSGIIHAPDLHRAIFQSPGAAKPIVTEVGERQTIDDWTVQDIGPESVTLIRDGQTVVLTPAFGAITIHPPPEPRPVSRWVAPAKSGILRARWSNPQLQP